MLRGTVARAIGAAFILAAGPFVTPAAAQGYFSQHPVGDVRLSVPLRQSIGVWWGSGNALVDAGAKLFFDTRLSGTGAKACATCHNPGFAFAEPRWVSISDTGRLGRRNAPSLLDVGYLPKLTWDGRFPTLEHQAFGPFQSEEMGIGVEQAVRRVNSDPQYVHLFQTAFGGWATPDSLARALAAFQRTLVSPASRVDRFMTNNEAAILTPLERDGYQVFTRRAACSNCHHPFPLQADGRPSARPLFTDFRFHNLGVGYRGGFSDEGRYELSRNPVEWGAFRTPSLRNSAKSPPYMHDGSLGTLEEVVEFYNSGGRPNPNISPLIRPLLLSEHEKAALVAFLRAMGSH